MAAVCVLIENTAFKNWHIEVIGLEAEIRRQQAETADIGAEGQRPASSPGQKEPVIKLRSVSKIYKIGSTRLKALDGVDLDILPGEFCCIIGRSGSGKSTLLNMIAGLEPPTRGSVRVAGRQIERMSETQLVEFRLENIGFVFQSFNLFPIHTALDNVAMPLMYKGVARARRARMARSMLKAVGLESHMNHKPAQMSGGQQQRVGIARALVSRPRILFADEPTGNLDLRTSGEILRLITSITRKSNTTLIVVTHDPEMAQYADRVVRLLDGRVQSIDVNPNPAPIPEGELAPSPELYRGQSPPKENGQAAQEAQNTVEA